MQRTLFAILITSIISVTGGMAMAEETISNTHFSLCFNKAGITGLKHPDDVFDTDYIMEGRILGDVEINYMLTDGEWRTAMTAKMPDKCLIKATPTHTPSHYAVSYNIGIGEEHHMVLSERFTLKKDTLIWMLDFQNETDKSLKIGDIALPLLFNTQYVADTTTTYEKRLVKHSFISGHGSYIIWMRPNGVGPYLVMMPVSGTKLEYFTAENSEANYNAWEGTYTAYIHSAMKGQHEKRGTWRQAHTSVTLKPKGTPGDTVTYGFKFRWADNYDAVRDILYEEGGFDIQIVPGMVVPNNLSAMFSLRTKNKIDSITAQHPTKTRIEYLGEKQKDTHVLKIKFSRLGENLLTVKYGNGKYMVLEFFVTQPLETLIKKRAAFITNKQQHKSPDKWYNGLFSLWDMRRKILLGPDNTGGFNAFMVSGSDDPSNSKCAYLAEKNVVYPDPKEIAALEYFIKNFVWGKHQRTDTEHPYPYGIYGSNNWYENRHSDIGFNSGGIGQERLWRTFDYTTYLMLYYNMYRIAKQNPGMTKYLDAAGYLERAFGTAKAFFTVPYNIKMGKQWSFQGWCDWAYKQGNFHEKYIVDLISSLNEEGHKEQADWLKREWEKKVKYFLYNHTYPFSSEMFFDSTAFESTHAIAKYALEYPQKPDKKLWYDKNLDKWYSYTEVKREDAVKFMEKQIAANIACRGWIEKAYYHLGSDFRGLGSSRYTLSYMSQMGGWAILDYALYYSENPAEYMRLAYASILSSWALVNSGTPESNYGCWYPGKDNDGAVGWGFMPEKFGRTWCGGIGEIERGIWFVDGEIDHGLAGGVNAAATVVVDDPIFGLFAYGGRLEKRNDTIRVICLDGVRRRFHIITDNMRLHMLLDRDGFAKDKYISVNNSLSDIRFTLENRAETEHTVLLNLSGLPAGHYVAAVNGKVVVSMEVKGKSSAVVSLPVLAETEQSEVRILRTVSGEE